MHTPKRNRSTETGQVSRYEYVLPLPGEPIQPLSLPEMDDPEGTTGSIKVVSEGVDESKDADESRQARKP